MHVSGFTAQSASAGTCVGVSPISSVPYQGNVCRAAHKGNATLSVAPAHNTRDNNGNIFGKQPPHISAEVGDVGRVVLCEGTS